MSVEGPALVLNILAHSSTWGSAGFKGTFSLSPLCCDYSRFQNEHVTFFNFQQCLFTESTLNRTWGISAIEDPIYVYITLQLTSLYTHYRACSETCLYIYKHSCTYTHVNKIQGNLKIRFISGHFFFLRYSTNTF